MSERKVLNKYYPPDFDPAKIPRMKLAKNRQYTVRLMAPFNMRCVTCGEYIYKGKKFNARKEDVEDQTYLGIRIYRFYIKCTRCLQEISFKTDPQNTDYEIEAGATRNFMALKLAEEQARKELDELKEEEANNPMKLLENRTEQSRNEIELVEALEELRDLNRRQQSVDFDTMLQQFNPTETEQEREARLAKQDEELIRTIKFGAEAAENGLKRSLVKDEVVKDEDEEIEVKRPTFADIRQAQAVASNKLKAKPTITGGASATAQIPSVGGFTKNNALLKNLVQKKATPSTETSTKPNPTAIITAQSQTKSTAANALSLLSGYSDSSGSEDSS